MDTISSLDKKGFTFAETSVTSTLCRTMPLALLVLTILAMPIAAIAKDKDNDHDRDDQRRSLVNNIHAKAEIAALQKQVTDLKNQMASLTSTEASLLSLLKSAQTDIGALQAKLNALISNGGSSTGGSTVLSTLAKYVTVDPNPINGMNGPNVIFTGVNVHIRSGSGSTGDGGTPTGLGNLLVGYNGLPIQGGGQRIGSHNIIGGDGNSFSSFGGLVFGSQNTIGGPYTAILGGESNQANGFASSILGGRANFVGSGDQTIP
jgi:hypothetical protein